MFNSYMEVRTALRCNDDEDRYMGNTVDIHPEDGFLLATSIGAFLGYFNS